MHNRSGTVVNRSVEYRSAIGARICRESLFTKGSRIILLHGKGANAPFPAFRRGRVRAEPEYICSFQGPIGLILLANVFHRRFYTIGFAPALPKHVRFLKIRGRGHKAETFSAMITMPSSFFETQ